MIVREGGVRGMWKGWVPNVQRAALVNLGGLFSHCVCRARTFIVFPDVVKQKTSLLILSIPLVIYLYHCDYHTTVIIILNSGFLAHGKG